MNSPSGVYSIVGCSSIVAYDGYSYDALRWMNSRLQQSPAWAMDVRLDCGCGAKKWRRDKPGNPCDYCGREPEVAW